MNGLFIGLMLSQVVMFLWRVFKKIWWIPVSLYLGDCIGTSVGNHLNMAEQHIAILTWMFAALLYAILKFKIIDPLRKGI